MLPFHGILSLSPKSCAQKMERTLRRELPGHGDTMFHNGISMAIGTKPLDKVSHRRRLSGALQIIHHLCFEANHVSQVRTKFGWPLDFFVFFQCTMRCLPHFWKTRKNAKNFCPKGQQESKLCKNRMPAMSEC